MSDKDNPNVPDPAVFTDPSPKPAEDGDLAVLGDALMERGVTSVTVHYEGSGDSGAVTEVAFEPPDVFITDHDRDWVCEVAENYCPDGYEINEGGYGLLIIHPSEGLAQLEHWERYEDTEDMEVPSRRLPARLRRQLRQLGLTTVTAQFDGSGDSGQFYALDVEPSSVTLADQLQNQLEDFFADLLAPGWENNAGSFGDFTVDVATGTVVGSASWRVEQDSEAQITRWKWRKS